MEFFAPFVALIHQVHNFELSISYYLIDKYMVQCMWPMCMLAQQNHNIRQQSTFSICAYKLSHEQDNLLLLWMQRWLLKMRFIPFYEEYIISINVVFCYTNEAYQPQHVFYFMPFATKSDTQTPGELSKCLEFFIFFFFSYFCMHFPSQTLMITTQNNY